MVNPSVIASEGADANNDNVDRIFRGQKGSLNAQIKSYESGIGIGLGVRQQSTDFGEPRRTQRSTELVQFFQQCDLAGVIELVLYDPTEHVEIVVIAFCFAGNLLMQP